MITKLDDTRTDLEMVREYHYGVNGKQVIPHDLTSRMMEMVQKTPASRVFHKKSGVLGNNTSYYTTNCKPVCTKQWADAFAQHLTTSLRRVVQQSTIQRTGFQMQGALDRKRLTRVITGTSDYVRVRQDRTRGIDCAIYMSMDFSGSMWATLPHMKLGGKSAQPIVLEMASVTNYAIRKACLELGIAHKAIGWGCTSENNLDYEVLEDIGESSKDQGTKDIWNLVRSYGLAGASRSRIPESGNEIIKVVNSWRQPRDVAWDAHLATLITEGGGTPMENAFYLPWQELTLRPEHEKHLFVFTDGCPDDLWGGFMVRTRTSVADLIHELGKRALLLKKAFNIHTHLVSLAARPSAFEGDLANLNFHVHENWTDVQRDITDQIADAIHRSSKELL